MDMKIFVDTDSDIRLCRRLQRDTQQRGRNFKDVLAQHKRHVQPAFKVILLIYYGHQTSFFKKSHGIYV